MSSAVRFIGRLANRSPREIAGRAGQLARARLEALGVGDSGAAVSGERLARALRPAGIRDEADLAQRIRERLANASFPAFRDPAGAVACLDATWPTLGGRVISRARRIEADRFDLLGYRGLDFGTPIDWHRDPIADRRAPEVHWSRVPYLDPDAVGDHKIVWELNRHQYFVALGQAYWSTSDERWADLFVEHVRSWLAANPPKIGINWASSLEVAFRSISWLWGLHFFARSDRLTDRFVTDIVAALRLHGRHVERYASTHFSPNTHLTGEALGLVYLGTLLPELPEADRWRSRGREWLMGALEFQIRPDGGYFEQSTHYHRYTADFYLHLLLLTRLREELPPAGLEENLERIVDHLVAVIRPDRRIPHIGDDDGGRLAFLDDRPAQDVRSTLLTAAVVLERPDWACVAGKPSEELFWLLGPDGLRALDRMDATEPAEASRALRDTGFFVMRSGWAADDDYAIVRCGPHGGLSGGHAHADALSLELAISGEPLIVDPGTASYTEPALRDGFRSTTAHNTVSVAGAGSSEPAGPFGWRTRAGSTLHEWIGGPGCQFFEGSHDGFARIWPGMSHARSVLWIPGEYWVIRDVISMPGDGSIGEVVTANYQLAPGLDARSHDGSSVEVLRAGDPVAWLSSLTGEPYEAEVGRVSPAYGDVRPATRITHPVRGGAGARIELVSLIAPRPVLATELTSESGRAWRIGEADLLVFGYGAGTRVETPDGQVETDFRVLWYRPDPGSAPSSLLAIGGRRLGLAPRTPLELPAAVRYLSVPLDREPEIVAVTGVAEGAARATESVSRWWRE